MERSEPLARPTFAGWFDSLRYVVAEIILGGSDENQFCDSGPDDCRGATTANAAETVTVNAIDANRVGKEIGTLRLSDSG